MNRQFIQSLSIDWNKIDNDSYLREIEALNQLEEVVFEKPITFFVGENGSGKSTLLEALAVSYGFNSEGGTKIILFQPMILILRCIMHFGFQRDFVRQNGGIFSEQKAFIMWQRKKKRMRILNIPQSDIMKNPMGKASLRLRRIICGPMDCTCLTSQKRHYLLKGN